MTLLVNVRARLGHRLSDLRRRRASRCRAASADRTRPRSIALRGRGQRRGEERPAALALAALEVAVRRADRVLARAASWSPFIAMHIEQPASRQSAPAALKTSASPSRSASRFTSSRAGHDHHPDAVGDVPALEHARPRARRSLIRPFVHEPMKTTSTFWPRIAWPGCRSMYSSARSSARRWLGSACVVGRRDAAGDRDPHARVRAVGDHRLERIGVDRDRLVERGPVVGRQRAASARPPRPRRRPAARAAGRGRTRTWCRPGRSARPARRPRCSCCRSSCAAPWSAPRIASPRYSKTWPVPPPTPIRAMSARMMSLAADAGSEPPVDAHLVGLRVPLEQRLGREHHLDLARPDPERERTERTVGRSCASRRRRSSCRAASGPSCGPMTWTMPWWGEPMPWSGIPNSAQFVSSCLDLGRGHRVEDRQAAVVGRDRVVRGRHRLRRAGGRARPRSRSPEKACGLVTSWTRCRSTARTAGAPGSCVTTWSSQIFWTMVRGSVMAATG